MEQYSVLMSVYAKEKPEHLTAALESLWEQTVPAAQVVLVCDGPLSPELEEVIAAWQSRYKERFCPVRLPENRGLAAALNAGLAYCEQDILVRMDADDIAFPDRCEKQLRLMAAAGADIVSGTVLEFDASPEEITAVKKLPASHEEILTYCKRRNPFNHPAVMMRAAWVRKVGGYEVYPLFEDYHLWVKMLLSGAKGANVTDPVLYMRAGSGMYRRRGGLRYAGYAIRMERYKKSRGLIGTGDMLISCTIKILMALIPAKWRKGLYKKFLR